MHPLDKLRVDLAGRPFELREWCPRCYQGQTFYFDRKAEFMEVRYYQCWECDHEIAK